MSLLLYNTRTRGKNDFLPIDPKEVKIYSCGPTVYDFQHIGNMRTYIFVDILRRVLEHKGYSVTHVENITDVGHLVSDGDTGEDKMEKGAKREGKSAWDIADFYTHAFMQDINRLNIQHPHIWCKATDHINEQIDLVKKLEEKGFTYAIKGDGIYFDTSKFPEYGSFARLNIDELEAGKRVEMVEGKKNITDFALWKFSPKNVKREMEWDSPWGKGFPGWHIECSAMSMKYLGDRIDIHTGGIDHISVHHTNEIAQNNSATGHNVVEHWMHGEFLVIGKNERMGKSLGNFITLQTLMDQGYDPLVFRFFVLNTHYRSPLHFHNSALDSAHEGLERIRQFIRILKEREDQENPDIEELISQTKKKFERAISDDLNIPQVLGSLFEMIKEINKQIDDKQNIPAGNILTLIAEMDRVLALSLLGHKTDDFPHEIAQLIAQRKAARDTKDWESSDALRNKLEKLGYSVEDTAKGQRVVKRS